MSNEKKLPLRNFLEKNISKYFPVFIDKKIFENIEDVNRFLNNDFLSELNDKEFMEISIHGNKDENGYFEDDTVLMILKNKTKSMCTFFNSIEDQIGYTSFNKNGKKGVYEEFILSNGQRDKYEDIYLVDNEEIKNIILSYCINRTCSKSILWEKW